MGVGMPGEQLLAAIIVGASTLTAAVIKAVAYLRAGPPTGERPPLRFVPATVLVAGGLVAAAIMLTDGSDLRGLAGRMGLGGVWAGSAGGAGAAELSDWLYADGTTLYYRHDHYLDPQCEGTVAVGNWARGREEPVPVRCLEDGWLALELAPLLRSGRMVRNLTYCVNFRHEEAWGRHAAFDAPGFQAVAVPATTIPLGQAIGFRVQRGPPVDRLVLGDSYPRASC